MGVLALQIKLLSVCLVLLTWTSAGDGRTVIDALNSRFDFITFTNFLRRVGLDKDLTTGQYMVLVPNDAAFEVLPDSFMTSLHDKHHKRQLMNILKYHIIPYTGHLNKHWTGQTINTLASKPVRLVTYAHNKVSVVNGVIMKESNVSASNGHIYVIDEVLIPASQNIYLDLERDVRFSSFLTAVNLAGMRGRLKEDNITVLAPTNDAFQQLEHSKIDVLYNSHTILQGFVEFYILPGTFFTHGFYMHEQLNMTHAYDLVLNIRLDHRQMVHFNPGFANVIQPDWLATNGVIHVIDHVILPHWFKNHVLIG